jgi:hypothetical protein
MNHFVQNPAKDHGLYPKPVADASKLVAQNPLSNYHLISSGAGFWANLGTSEVLDARRRGAPTEAYK